MTPEEYEQLSEEFKLVNRELNIAKRVAEEDPSDENTLALREAKLNFYDKREELDAAYAALAASVPVEEEE